MTTALVTADAIEQVLIGGDLARLTAEQRLTYYRKVCDSLGLNPLTKPFEYITLSGRLTLYARKDATEQLRKRHGVSIVDITSQRIEDVFIVTAKAIDRDARTDVSTGAVAIGGLKGEALANAFLKAETKAKRRVTLSICGLGMLDESELPEPVAAAPDHRPVTGEVTPPVTSPELPPPSVISEAQRKRLFAIAKEVGWTTDELKTFLGTQGYTSSKDIAWTDYDRIVALVQRGGSVPGDDAPFSS